MNFLVLIIKVILSDRSWFLLRVELRVSRGAAAELMGHSSARELMLVEHLQHLSRDTKAKRGSVSDVPVLGRSRSSRRRRSAVRQ